MIIAVHTKRPATSIGNYDDPHPLLQSCHMLLFNRGVLSTRGTLGLIFRSASRRILLYPGYASKTRCISSTRHDRDNVPATWSLWFAGVLGVSVVTWTVWKEYQPFRHSVLAAVRCSRVAGEVTMFMLYLSQSSTNCSRRCCTWCD